MTDDRVALAELLQKCGDGDLLRAVAEGCAAASDGSRCRVIWRERAGNRLNYRRYHDAPAAYLPAKQLVLVRILNDAFCSIRCFQAMQPLSER